jgi:two-component system response regulator HydG
VRGETGVGKELVARAIHAGSARRGGPFVVVDCGAVAAGLFESTLFGHEKGAFTGATKATLGAFRAAHGGTIFLDEIGELPLDLQPKLLRVLQEKEVMAVGGERPVPVDVRVVAGTNRDLAHEAEQGRFREDLLYRLRVVEIVVPPLRARRKDIPELAEAFLREVAARRGLPPKRLAADAVAALMDHDWPGNVRELEHAMEAAALYAVGDEILAADLPMAGEMFRRRAAEKVAAASGGQGLRETLEELERERLVQALKDHGGNRSAAAKALGLSRGALLRRIERYGVEG